MRSKNKPAQTANEREWVSALAQQLLYRDRPGSGDDRRVCFECAHLRENVRCRPGHLPLRFVLQRCDGFELRGTA